MKWISVKDTSKQPKKNKYSNILKDHSAPVLIYGPFECHYDYFAFATYYPLSEWYKQTGHWYRDGSSDEEYIAKAHDVYLWLPMKDIPVNEYQDLSDTTNF